jgi:hypothetical protein
MREVAEHAPELSGKAAKRAAAALALRVEPEEFDRAEGRKTFAALIGDRPIFAQRGLPARKVRRMARPLGRTGKRTRS